MATQEAGEVPPLRLEGPARDVEQEVPRVRPLASARGEMTANEERLAKIIRGLRADHYRRHVHRYAHERVWEEEDETERREEQNKEAKKKFDAETEAMIAEVIQ